MSEASDRRCEEFLKVSGEFKLGDLITETSHPVTARLSEVAKQDIAAALDLLLQVDADVVARYRQFAESGRADSIHHTVVRALRNGGKLFFTGCGSTGRLSIQLVSIWRSFWQEHRARGNGGSVNAREWEDRAHSVMAGGDFALIKSVEGFEDIGMFGRKQVRDLGVCDRDVVFAISEGGETSFVIGSAWESLESGAKVYFVYNNPDEVLCGHVQRSRELIEEDRIEKLNLTTGPMAITGSTRMQATSIQLCVLLTILEMAVRELSLDGGGAGRSAREVPGQFLEKLKQMHDGLRSPEVLCGLGRLVSLEESVYRAGGRTHYFADRFGIDVLTDTTERSPTYCVPPFRKFGDGRAAESWAFLFLPDADTRQAWERVLRRHPRCVEWSDTEIRELVGQENSARFMEVVRQIGCGELMRFKIGMDGLPHRGCRSGDSAIGIAGEWELDCAGSAGDFFGTRLAEAQRSGAETGLLYFSAREPGLPDLSPAFAELCLRVHVPVPRTEFLLDGITRVGVKMVLNALSTCTMVRLGRVMGNYMIWVVPTNFKLIDRATRYIQKLAGLGYAESNRLLFEVIEYIEPRLKSDQSCPPAVGLAVMRARYGLGNEEAEQRLR